jgi:hypothetical protein
MKTYLLLTILLFSFLSFSQNNVGPGNCVDFSANITNANHVNLGGLSWINQNDFTIECWMKVNSVFDDEAFFSNKDWSSGNNTGIVFDVQDNGNNMKFNFKDNTNPRKDLTVPVQVLNRDWFHFAGTYKRGGYFVVYINGQAKDSLNVSSITSSFASQYTYKLGQDGTGNYTYNGANPRFDGKIDEFRVWSQVRTPQQIRDNMCQSLIGNENNLFAYYNFNESTGIIFSDLTTNAVDANLVNGVAANRVISGAPIGNISINKYGASLTSEFLELTMANSGTFKINSFNAITGVHLYQVNSLPTLSNGLSVVSGNAGYFGVFVCDTNASSTYNSRYDYTNFATAISDENNLILFNRLKNDYIPWTNSVSTQSNTNNTFIKINNTTSKEWILGTTTGLPCHSIDSIFITNGTPTSATVGWNSDASNWNIVWGVQGFEFANGQEIINTTTNPYTFSNLSSGVVYEMYVQDTCLGTGAGIWMGPFTFTGQICQSPSQLDAIEIGSSSAKLTWTNNVTGVNLFAIEWGLQGFPQGVGIPINNVQLPYVLSGLSPATTYDYYVKTICGTNNSSSWSGPHTFTTLSNVGLEENELNTFISPNPFNEEFSLTFPNISNEEIIIVDALGRNVSFTSSFVNENQVKIKIENTQNQLLLLRINSASSTKTFKIKSLSKF